MNDPWGQRSDRAIAPTALATTLDRALARVGDALAVVGTADAPEFLDWEALNGERPIGLLPSIRPERLGDPGFLAEHGARYPYVGGAMANGIASAEVVEALAGAGMLGIFGAAGLPIARVEAAIDRLGASLGDEVAHGFNLIHSPNDPSLEDAVVDLYLRKDVRLVEASAYLDLTLPVVRYRTAGIRRGADGRAEVPNRVMAKVSRVEVARKFLAPPPARLVQMLVDRGELTAEQAELCRQLPMAGDLTAEADSGGHTDNQPAVVLLPTMLALRDQLQAEHRFDRPTRVGAAGGISTPWAAASAFAMGAAYIVGGSVHQACRESGTSDLVRRMLAEARQADVAMAPAADMFEMGVKVQVLKRGTMFAMRAAKLYELYRQHASIEALPPAERESLEKTLFRAPLEAIWDQTRVYFQGRDPAQVDRALRDPKHRLALVFRWYLGQASHWANAGVADRAIDYQIWCGPSMAAFNDWARGSFLERAEGRGVATVALNILYGASVLGRARCLSGQGIALPTGVPTLRPLPAAEIHALLAD